MRCRIRPQITTVVLLAMLLLTVFYAPLIHATPPTEIDLEYNQSTQTLAVNVTHEVPNPKNHYIQLIEVFKNGVFQFNRTYPEQQFNYGLNDTFTIIASSGDNLTVTATCSRGHFLSAWILASSTTSGSTSTTSTGTTSSITTTTGTQTNTTLEPLSPSAVFVVGLTLVVILVILMVLYQSGYGEKLRPLLDRIRTGLIALKATIGSFVGGLKGRLTRK
ncbi:MAG: hypothetical protein ACFFAY_02550 [Promethearchaeota archaeon]